MRSSRLLSVVLALSLAACSSGGGDRPSTIPETVPGRGVLEISVEPNPILATDRQGDTYSFPFTVRIRETGGVEVHIDEVRMDVVALGAINVYSERFGREEIIRRGYPTTIGAGSEIRYSFNPRKEVPDERIFGGVAAELTATGRDANGNQVRATTRVTVQRRS